jgi:hypothetical protein
MMEHRRGWHVVWVVTGVLAVVFAASCGQSGEAGIDTTQSTATAGGGLPATSGIGGAGGDGAMVCGDGLTSCFEKCVDTTSDAAHCGACDTACAPDEYCDASQCALACGPGTIACGENCVDTEVDPAHCGACDASCAAGEVCSQGMCALNCGGGTTICDGICSDTDHDPAHCGACGNACSAAAQAVAVCAQGVCHSVCQAGFADCNADINDGCEIDLVTDMQHCGGCGAGCPDLPNASESCMAGQCVLGSCAMGYANCDNDPNNGCEANLATDGQNCGMCGKACAFGEACLAGQCVQAGCQNGGVLMATAPGGTMIVCDDPNNNTCEQDAETLCPLGWGLCSRSQYVNRNNGWNYAVNGGNVVVAEIHCRGASGAGHYTLGPYGGISNLGEDIPLNCGYGSSRPSCTTGYGCNEKDVMALCCQPTATCGNGMLEAPEEDCDDGNSSETDDCLNSCSWRQPNAHNQSGCN